MSIKENIALALVALWSNKMRALLTMLGIIIGIGSVITIFTIGNALNGYIMNEMSSMGANNVTLGLQQKESENSSRSGAPAQMRESDLLTDEMLLALFQQYESDIETIDIQVQVGSGTATNESSYANFDLTGAGDMSNVVANLEMVEGRFLLSREVEDEKNVVVVSDLFAKNLGIEDSALGTQIMLQANGRTPALYTVVGVYKYEESAFAGMGTSNEQDTSTTAYIPYSVAQHITNAGDGYASVTVLTKQGADSAALATEMQTFLNTRYYGKNESFEIFAFAIESLIDTMQSMLSTMQLAIAAVAAISLVVGGIGVMNIMLVSITERTKEIGTRKALGATNFSIRMQFITESAIICLIGGIIGIALGVGLGSFASQLLQFPASADLMSIGIAVGFSVGIGIFFGYYPANKAAKLDPIDALRYE